MKYKLLVDYGKPFKVEFETIEEVFNYLSNLENSYNKEEIAYVDIKIFTEKEITNSIFKNYNLKKEKIGFI